MAPQLFKIVAPDGAPLHGGAGAWPLPTDTEPGAWRTVDGDIVPCVNGLHLTDAAHIETWLPRGGRPFAIYRAETDGPVIDAGEKYVTGRARLLPRAVPVPDLSEAASRRDARIKRSERRYALAVPEPWQSYLAGVDRLPAGHPGIVYRDRLAEARDEHAAEVARAHNAYRKAVAKVLAAA